MKIFFTALIVLFLVVVSIAIIHKHYVTKNSLHLPWWPYYFSSFASYIKPFRPIDEITLDEVNQRKKQNESYYEAYFDEQWRIVTFIKFSNNNMIFRETYEYKNGELINSVMQKFDEN
jgi:hypothetical protein